MKANEAIIAEVAERGYITEKEISLLKCRSNREGRDVINYELLSEAVPVTPEQGAKGLLWLKKLLKRNGEPREGQNLGWREIDIIKNATENDFKFVCLYDCGNKWFSSFVPVYRCGAMEYYVLGGKINVVG